MNVGLYSAAAGMRVGQDYQQMVSENLSFQSVPGYRQTLPVFTTEPDTVTTQPQLAGGGNPAAVRLQRVTDFTQGPMSPDGETYHLAIKGDSFFQIREANGATSYTRNGSFSLSPTGQLRTSDGATVLGKGGSPISIDVSKAGKVSIGGDGTISMDGLAQGGIGLAHFDKPSTSLEAGAFGRFNAVKKSDAKDGPAANDQVVQGALESSNGNPVAQMADMIQAVRLYEANQKSIQAVDDNQNKLITNLGSRPQA